MTEPSSCGVAAVESGYMKQALVSSHAARRGRIESGQELVVGVNIYQSTEPSPLTADLDAVIQTADPEAERSAVAGLARWREQRGRARSTMRCSDWPLTRGSAPT